MQEIANSGLGDETESGRAERSEPNKIRRAHRYEICTVIRYRVRGEHKWHEGTTENISTTGLLIRADHSPDPDTILEMTFFLPVALYGERAAEVCCRGVIVRLTNCVAPAGAIAFACTIVHARLLRYAPKMKNC